MRSIKKIIAILMTLMLVSGSHAQAATAKGWFGREVRLLLMRLGTAVAASLLLVCAVSGASGAPGERDGYRADRTAAYMPFYTLGGSNLCVTCLYAGILLSVYRNSSVVRC